MLMCWLISRTFSLSSNYWKTSSYLTSCWLWWKIRTWKLLYGGVIGHLLSLCQFVCWCTIYKNQLGRYNDNRLWEIHVPVGIIHVSPLVGGRRGPGVTQGPVSQTNFVCNSNSMETSPSSNFVAGHQIAKMPMPRHYRCRAMYKIL